MGDNGTVLEVKDLKTYYRVMKGDVKAVDNLNLTVRRGEILGVVGESGCGKSTLAYSLISLKKPLQHISGEANLLGQDLMQLSSREKRKLKLKNISIIPQYALDAFSPTKKIKTFIKDLVKQHGRRADRKFMDKVKARFKIVNLSPTVLERYSMELSGGMKQRVVMLISSLLDPDLLIADEITSALDVTSQRFVTTLLADLRDEGIIGSAIFITHDLATLYQIADRILVMYAGRLAELGAADEIVHNPRHPYTRDLINSLPRIGIQHKDERLTGIKGTPPDLTDIGEGCRFRFRCQHRTVECDSTPKMEEPRQRHYIRCWNYKSLGSDQNE